MKAAGIFTLTGDAEEGAALVLRADLVEGIVPLGWLPCTKAQACVIWGAGRFHHVLESAEEAGRRWKDALQAMETPPLSSAPMEPSASDEIAGALASLVEAVHLWTKTAERDLEEPAAVRDALQMGRWALDREERRRREQAKRKG